MDESCVLVHQTMHYLIARFEPISRWKERDRTFLLIPFICLSDLAEILSSVDVAILTLSTAWAIYIDSTLPGTKYGYDGCGSAKSKIWHLNYIFDLGLEQKRSANIHTMYTLFNIYSRCRKHNDRGRVNYCCNIATCGLLNLVIFAVPRLAPQYAVKLYRRRQFQCRRHSRSLAFRKGLVLVRSQVNYCGLTEILQQKRDHGDFCGVSVGLAKQ